MALNDEDDDFDFSDDLDLDALPANTLQELESAAIASTQHQDKGFVNNSFIPYQENVTLQNGYGYTNVPPQYTTQNVPPPADSDYGDDEIINLDDESLPAQAFDSHGPRMDSFAPVQPQWAPDSAAQYSQAGQNHYSNQHVQYAQQEHFYEGTTVEMEMPTQGTQVDTNQLLARIKKLEQEKARLNREVDAEKSKVMSKSGEADIVRRRLEAATKEQERKIAALQHEQNEKIKRLNADLEKMKRERDQIETDKFFTEQSLAREADKAKARRNLKNAPVAKSNKVVSMSPSTTPKRHKSLPYRGGDGFDDTDIIMTSPSKSRDRKAFTPKQGGKRKRQTVDHSPPPALQFSESTEGPKLKEEPSSVELQLDPTLLAKLQKEDHRFELFERFVNHRSSNGDDRVLEALTQYAFPSKPEKKLSSILYDQISDIALEDDVHVLALKFSHVFLSLWGQCLKETYYAPIYLILDGLQFILACEPCTTAVALTERALPLIIDSVDLVAVPIARASTNPSFLSARDAPDQVKLRQEIDVLDCLSLMHVIAISCVMRSDAIMTFWQIVPFDHVLILLNKAQPYHQIMLMLRILSTSSLSTTLGAIVSADSAPDQQTKRESDLLNRLTNLLFEIPKPLPEPNNATPPTPYSAEQIVTMRLQVLELLKTFAIRPHGSSTLAHNPYVLARLIRYLDASITSLYRHPLSPTHEPTVSSINETMRLVYYLMKAHPDVDIRSKLSAVQGGSHKYLVSLTRLAFSEGPERVLEAGIAEDVSDAAHELLDRGLSPEEGEGLLRAFAPQGVGSRS
ncbi:hypothetical protein GQ43DRAFT_440751 [Delitschia confertaspora ATCC 74209]|uniref:DNA repair protein Rad26 n=1 Tax=Delitschia confertaspora ATCC 74209 TaxID=1513339 RepID=A0A9P4MVL9_9PLEO|nr:hypothetical protein GQ43DRAFT_440751 [Delitschia confertaspora ATCC 74209]